LHRALRACASAGLFTESNSGQFGATPLTAPLCRGAAGSVREFVELIGGQWWTLFGALPDALRTGHNQTKAVLDLPDVIAIAERQVGDVMADVRRRLTLVAGDMFVDVPPGDLYVLRRIVHDWDDARAVRVLGNCRARLAPGGRVVCMDNVLPALGDTGCPGAKFLDMLMMVSLPGKERTELEWRTLYGAAGLSVTRITPVGPRSGASIVEGVPR
jgi:hypothetical protein